MKRVIPPPSPPWRYGDSDPGMAPMRREVYNPVIDVRIADVRVDHDIDRVGYGFIRDTAHRDMVTSRMVKISIEAPMTEELHYFLNILQGSGGRVQLTSPDVKRERVVPPEVECMPTWDGPCDNPDNTPVQPKGGTMKTQNAEVGSW